MNRRHFLGQVALGSAVLASHLGAPLAAAGPGGLVVKFVGMMGYVRRSDGSMLVALPGHHSLGHFAHVPFLMARSGSSIAAALGLTPMPGVAAGAFDAQLADAPSGAFVFRCLDGIDLEISSRMRRGVAVDHQATELAQMQLIARGKRLRGDLRRWSSTTVTLLGGQLVNAAAHPDAGKVWSFGSYKQRLTDATLHYAGPGTIRLSAGRQMDSFAADDRSQSELWVVSAAGPTTDAGDPKRLDHGGILFEYLNDATSVVAYCPEAEGRLTLGTELPCSTSAMASRSGGVARMAPPYMELCYGGDF